LCNNLVKKSKSKFIKTCEAVVKHGRLHLNILRDPSFPIQGSSTKYRAENIEHGRLRTKKSFILSIIQ